MSRPKDRVTAAGLLPAMEARVWSDGVTITYRFKPKTGPWVNLGTDRQAALQQVLDLTGQNDAQGTLAWVWGKWKTSKRWLRLVAGTQADYELAWKQIDKRFGHMQAASITPVLVARYVHVEREDSPRRADIEKTVMSNLFKHGVRLGVCSSNPTVDVEPHGSEASTVMPATAAIKAFATWLDAQTAQRKVLSCAMRFVALEGSRQVEFLQVTWPQVDRQAKQIRLIRAKQRGKKREQIVEVIRISPAMEALLVEIEALGREGSYLFPTEDNNAYSAKGFKTLWQRCIVAAIEAKVISAADRFNFHALRRYYATMHKAEHGVLPDLHANPAVTAQVYDGTREVPRKAL